VPFFIGVQCLVVDNFVVSQQAPRVAGESFKIVGFQPGEWLPWILMSMGGVVGLYAFTLSDHA